MGPRGALAPCGERALYAGAGDGSTGFVYFLRTDQPVGRDAGK